ncbi:hypothetical protein BLS_009031 [Venturia inaequalis]|uniref:Uncharacterized protein n=1 Tax=Venturia inaequalis TaxID=5025 RepID=A0A8H3VQQ5_VENIN|nr:hypothetical protein BLS_009031 [Venturia inaequalis]KAE9993644.1 hypothetical protein EG327_003908 [Venturia inaequalis]RDI88599.1 Quinate permease [Venturia inaequalis]
MDPNFNDHSANLQTELEGLRTAKAISDKELEEMKREKESHAKEKQAWNEERNAWGIERESFSKQKRCWDAERRARALEKEFEEEHHALHSHFMQMIQGINDATAEMAGEGFGVEDGDDGIIEAMSEGVVQQQTAEEPQQPNTQKEKCKVIIGNVRRIGKQWLGCVEAATKEDPDFAFSVEDVQAQLDAAAELLEMMEDSEEPISEV